MLETGTQNGEDNWHFIKVLGVQGIDTMECVRCVPSINGLDSSAFFNHGQSAVTFLCCIGPAV